MLPVHLVTVRLLPAAWTASEVIEEEGSYASRFYRWFSESSKSCLLFLMAPPGLIDTFAQLLAWRSLSMIWWWMYLTQSDFLSTKSLAWYLALHLFCFSQEKPQRWKEIPTHTHTHTRARAHTERLVANEVNQTGIIANYQKLLFSKMPHQYQIYYLNSRLYPSHWKKLKKIMEKTSTKYSPNIPNIRRHLKERHKYMFCDQKFEVVISNA